MLALEAAALLALASCGLGLVRARPAIALGILWFFVWLAPTNSILPRADAANDRQLYLALIGPAWLLARVAWREATGHRLVGAAVSGLLIALLAFTVAQNRVYADEIAFWRDVVRKAPSNARAFNNLGFAYAGAGRREEAEAAYRTAVALDPVDSTAPMNLWLLRDGR